MRVDMRLSADDRDGSEGAVRQARTRQTALAVLGNHVPRLDAALARDIDEGQDGLFRSFSFERLLGVLRERLVFVVLFDGEAQRADAPLPQYGALFKDAASKSRFRVFRAHIERYAVRRFEQGALKVRAH